MSNTNVKRIAKTRPAVDYELYGPLGSAKYRMHQRNGTTRVASIRCDLGSPEEFVERAEQLAFMHGRKIESAALYLSFHPDEFSVRSPMDMQEVVDLGYLLAKRIAPNSDVLAIGHGDGCGPAGGCAHCHIKIINHDNETGLALRSNLTHPVISRINDELMREHGLQVTVRSYEKDQSLYWEEQRNGVEDAFDKLLGDRIKESMQDPRSVDQAAYIDVLAEKGVTLVPTEHVIKASADGEKPEQVSIGYQYRMFDDVGEKPRMRRRKASTLSKEFTHAGVQEYLDANREAAKRPPVPAKPVITRTDLLFGKFYTEPDRYEMVKARYTDAEIDEAIGYWEWEQAQAEAAKLAEASEPKVIETSDVETPSTYAAAPVEQQIVAPDELATTSAAAPVAASPSAAAPVEIEPEVEVEPVVSATAPVHDEPVVITTVPVPDEQPTEVPADAAALADATAFAAAPSVKPWRSKLRDLKPRNEASAKKQQEWVALDELIDARLQAGQLVLDGEISKVGIGESFIKNHGARISPLTLDLLERRQLKKVAIEAARDEENKHTAKGATADAETSKALWERYKDEMAKGDYELPEPDPEPEEAVVVTPPRPAPVRESLVQRLHRENMEQAAGDSPQDAWLRSQGIHPDSFGDTEAVDKPIERPKG